MSAFPTVSALISLRRKADTQGKSWQKSVSFSTGCQPYAVRKFRLTPSEKLTPTILWQFFRRCQLKFPCGVRLTLGEKLTKSVSFSPGCQPYGTTPPPHFLFFLWIISNSYFYSFAHFVIFLWFVSITLIFIVFPISQSFLEFKGRLRNLGNQTIEKQVTLTIIQTHKFSLIGRIVF